MDPGPAARVNGSGFTPYPDLDGLLGQLVQGARLLLGPEFVGAYVSGLPSPDAEDDGSDVDVLVVARSALSATRERALHDLHRRSLEGAWTRRLHVAVVPQDALRADPAAIPWAPPPDGGVWDGPGAGPRATRWRAREHGVTLAGPHPATVIDPVAAGDLRAEARDLLRAWAPAALTAPDDPDAWQVARATVAVVELLHTLEAGTVEPRRAAAAWAARQFPTFAPAIDAAHAGFRERAARSGRQAAPGDVAQVRALLRAALDWTAEGAPAAVVARQLALYNARDLDAFMALWAPDARLYAHGGALLADGAAAVRARHAERFREPDLHARLVHRAVLGDRVVDHEVVTRSFPDGPRAVEVVVTYEVRGGVIRAAWLLTDPDAR